MERYNAVNEQISELVSHRLHLLARVRQIDLAINAMRGEERFDSPDHRPVLKLLPVPRFPDEAT